MSSLFLDTTKGVTLGLLDKDFKWLFYEFFENAKGSSFLHFKINSILETNSLDLADIKNVFYVSGPGSYTGMRLSEGLKQVLEWSGKKCYSFYHFDIPKIVGIKSGTWACDAFKNEAFVYTWDEKTEKKTLDLLSDLNLSDVYTSFESEKLKANTFTSKMIFNESQKVFKYIKEHKLKKELYYFRTLEQEFGR
ncbi:MAG: hypothetical protein N4A33_13625 [Bacteriovoracaceae bacterium]|jgi:tRNA threonylcarbamoyladenosine biosynthesis protein TsaB|nr:hypothetical protein [Bacteriovoracaceae bacterium]